MTVSAETDIDIRSNNELSTLNPDDPQHRRVDQTQPRRIGPREKGRDLQINISQQTIAQAIADGLRAPIPTSTSVQRQPPYTGQAQIGANVMTTYNGQARTGANVMITKTKMKTRGASRGKKTRLNNINKKRAGNQLKKPAVNNNKRRNANKKRNTTKNRDANNKRKQNAVKQRGSSSNTKKRNSRGSGVSKKRASTKKRGVNAMKKRATTLKYKKSSNMNKTNRGGSSASSFLQGINNALNRHQGYGSGGRSNHGNGGKPIKYKVSSGASSGWGGSTQSQNQIYWDQGTHTDTGWSGVLEPCACHDEPTNTWGGSSANGKSGKWGGGGKFDHLDCLCLVGGELPGGSYKTFLPTYFPTYYPTSYPTSFPTDQ